LCAQFTRDLLAIAKFLVAYMADNVAFNLELKYLKKEDEAGSNQH